MLLTLMERMTLETVLPTQGDYHTMCRAREIGEKVRPTAAELDAAEAKFTDGMVRIRQDKNAASEIEFSREELVLLKQELKKLADGHKLTMSHLDLYERLVLAPEP